MAETIVNSDCMPDLESILCKYEQMKLNTYKVLELVGSDYTFTDGNTDNDKRYTNLLNCGTILQFSKGNSTFYGSEKTVYYLTGANFCRQRICPMCQFRKAQKQFVRMYEVVKHLENDYRFLHLVLTVPNVDGGIELINTIDMLYKSYAKMFKYKDVKCTIKGTMRCLEISYNYDNDTFHPHLHCLLAVKPSYFNDSKRYISYDKWAEMWKKATKSEQFLQISIGAIKQGDYQGVAEVCKYCVKPLDLRDGNIYQNQKLLLTLWHTLKGMRFVQRYGIIKDTYRALFLTDDDSDDIIELSNTVDKCNDTFIVEWNSVANKYERTGS